MHILLFLVLVVFTGNAIAASVAIPRTDASVVARDQLSFTIVIPAMLYFDAATGDWRTNAGRAGPTSVTRAAGRPDPTMAVVHRSGGLTTGTVTTRAIGGGESRVVYTISMP